MKGAGEDSGRQSLCDLMEMKHVENVKHSKLHITEHTVLPGHWIFSMLPWQHNNAIKPDVLHLWTNDDQQQLGKIFFVLKGIARK